MNIRKCLTILVVAAVFPCCMCLLLGSNKCKRLMYRFSNKVHKTEAISKSRNLDGIDISHHQGNVDWSKVGKDKRIKYVYLKATEGATLRDGKYKTNLKAARKEGFRVGAYHYMTMSSSAKAQFENFKQMVGKDIDLLPMLDLEQSRHKSPLRNIRQRADSLMMLMEDYYGVKPMLYCTQDRYYIVCDDQYRLDEPYHILPKYQDYLLFWGQHTSAQPKFATTNNCIIWQYSDSNHLDGFRGTVDFSMFVGTHDVNDILLKR